MNQFWTLLKKEVKELLTPQLILPMVAIVIIFSFIGNVINKESKAQLSTQTAYIVDLDNSKTSTTLLSLIEASGFAVEKYSTVEEGQNSEQTLIFVIPKGFEQGIEKKEVQTIETYSRIKTLSLISNITPSIQAKVFGVIQAYVSDIAINSSVDKGSQAFIKTPIVPMTHISFNDKTVDGDIAAVLGQLNTQTSFIPVILFVVTTLSAQLIATAIATEKENKTLETLLSSPINRKLIVSAKLVAAAFVSILMAGMYMFGMRSYISGMMGGLASNEGQSQVVDLINRLGLTISTADYVIIGITLFLGIMVALSLAFILGSFASDTKSAQTVITPVMVMLLIPYLLTMLLDVTKLSSAIQALVYAIPFTHVFTAIPNALMDRYTNILYGDIYLLVVVLVSITIASKLFDSEKVFTFSLDKFLKKSTKQ